jgi:hypothetical protein
MPPGEAHLTKYNHTARKSLSMDCCDLLDTAPKDGKAATDGEITRQPSRRDGFASGLTNSWEKNSVSITSRGDPGKAFAVMLMTMIAYAFLQHSPPSNSKGEKRNQRATAPADFARRAPRHPRTHRSTTTAAMSALPKMDLQRAAA